MAETRVYEALRWASSFLKENGRDVNAGELLLIHLLGISRTQLFSIMQETIEPSILQSFEGLVHQHVGGTPVQYITGYEWFYGRKFTVTPSVLIPRPETEELIEETMRLIQGTKIDVNNGDAFLVPPAEKKGLKVCDIGTGSGAIAVTLASELPDLDVFAVDVSDQALRVAEQNAKNLDARVQFTQGDLLTPFIGKQTFDIILSNPPYITDDDMLSLDDVVREHEPHLALAGGVDGCDFYKEIIDQLPNVIKSQAIIGFEIGHGQATSVEKLFHDMFGSDAFVYTKHDINQKERMVFGLIGYKS